MSCSTNLNSTELFSFFYSPNLSTVDMFISPKDPFPNIKQLTEYAKQEGLTLPATKTKVDTAFITSCTFIIGGCSLSPKATIAYKPYWSCLWGHQFGYYQCIPGVQPKPSAMISKNFIREIKQQNSNLLSPLINVSTSCSKAFSSWWPSQYKDMVPLYHDELLSGKSLFI